MCGCADVRCGGETSRWGGGGGLQRPPKRDVSVGCRGTTTNTTQFWALGKWGTGVGWGIRCDGLRQQWLKTFSAWRRVVNEGGSTHNGVVVAVQRGGPGQALGQAQAFVKLTPSPSLMALSEPPTR